MQLFWIILIIAIALTPEVLQFRPPLLPSIIYLITGYLISQYLLRKNLDPLKNIDHYLSFWRIGLIPLGLSALYILFVTYFDILRFYFFNTPTVIISVRASFFYLNPLIVIMGFLLADYLAMKKLKIIDTARAQILFKSGLYTLMIGGGVVIIYIYIYSFLGSLSF